MQEVSHVGQQMSTATGYLPAFQPNQPVEIRHGSMSVAGQTEYHPPPGTPAYSSYQYTSAQPASQTQTVTAMNPAYQLPTTAVIQPVSQHLASAPWLSIHQPPPLISTQPAYQMPSYQLSHHTQPVYQLQPALSTQPAYTSSAFNTWSSAASAHTTYAGPIYPSDTVFITTSTIYSPDIETTSSSTRTA